MEGHKRKYFSKYQPAAQEVYESGGYPDPEDDYEYYEKWWETQLTRCIKGYKPNSNSIPICGDYYFHINFVHGEIFDTRTEKKYIDQFPYIDSDHETHNFLTECEQDKIGAIVMKGRRARFTTMMSSKMLCRWTVNPGTSLCVGAYGQIYVDKVRNMIDIARSKLPMELSYSVTNNPKILEATYSEKSRVGQRKDGTFSKIYFGNFGGVRLNAGVFRRLSAELLLMDEIGENPYIMDCLTASEECWKEGGDVYGTPILGGTSNLMKNPSKDLPNILKEPEAYGFRVHVIPRQRYYYKKGYDFCDTQKGTATPEQQEKARQYILENRQKLEKLENKTKFYMDFQENPTCLEDMLLGNSGNHLLPLDAINGQIKILNDYDSLKTRIRKYNLHWKNGRFNPQNPQVEWDTTKEDGEYWILEMPNKEYKNLDIGGIDTYYRSGAINSKSKGVMYIFRRQNDFDSSMLTDAPIAEYEARYPTTHQFYDGCLKLAVAYSHPGAPCKMLSEYDEAFLAFMEMANALRYFKEKPTAVDGIYSNTAYRYMVAMTGSTKTRATSELQQYLAKFIQNIGFDRLLENMKKYPDTEADNAMAFAVALIHNLDTRANLVNKTEDHEREVDDMPMLRRENGILTMPNSFNPAFQKSEKIDYLRPF